MARSAIINVMVQAAMKAGRSLARDFGEVQNLQVSLKGPGDYVSQADRKAEEIIHAELSRARPGYSFLMEERGEVEGDDASTAGSSIRSTAPPTSCTASRSFRSRSHWSDRASSSPASSTIRRWTSSTPPSVAAARS
jgi:3'-phosphoadenosine 5'-phosphosulfate (PAPS) 3'-phosphatase